jgi:hypothetical protein
MTDLFAADVLQHGFLPLRGQERPYNICRQFYWWLYLAVTIPLTIVVGLAWCRMLKRKGYGKLQTLAMDTIDVEMNSSQPAPGGSKLQ